MRKKSNMSLLTNHVLSGVALIAGLGLTASHAYAQHGTFNLPFEARWGSVALPLGPCRISALSECHCPESLKFPAMAGRYRLWRASKHCNHNQTTAIFRS